MRKRSSMARDEFPDDAAREKNPAAVALGRLGGRAGGPARAAKLTAQQRSEIARRASQRRWGAGGPPAPAVSAEAPGGEARVRILACAASLFALYGYSDVSMRELARRAGVGLPTIYALFGDKAGLYQQAWLHSLDQYTMALLDSVRGLKAGAQTVYGFCRTICRINADPSQPRLIRNHRLGADDPTFAGIAERVFNQQFGVLRASVALLTDDERADMQAYAVYALSHGLIQLSPVAQHSALDLPSARDPDLMAQRALGVVFPHIDWTAVAGEVKRRARS